MLRNSYRVNQYWVRKLSQANDTLLLLAGIAMAWLSHQYPFTHHWLTAKLLVLVIYIVAGTLALKRAKRRHSRIFFGLIAFACIGYILSVALTRNPMGWTQLGL
jgi:uncharacterized membrane protein SirB2